MVKRATKIGIVGCGTIGGEVARACRGRLRRWVRLSGIFDIDPAKARGLEKSLGLRLPSPGLSRLIDSADLVVEASSASACPMIVEKCLQRGRDVLVMSVGGLVGNAPLLERVARSRSRLYIPSGALSGIDGIKAAAVGRIDSITLTTRKGPRSLAGAPYIVKRGIDLGSICQETVIFDGSVTQAVKAFPQNINVAAVLALASRVRNKVRVRIVTSPAYTNNVHEVELRGESGTIFTRTENVPSARNPKTSQLAVWSAIATIEGIVSQMRVGT